jgi:hypothetical protein
MLVTIAGITREFDDPEVVVNAAIRGLRKAVAEGTPASH